MQVDGTLAGITDAASRARALQDAGFDAVWAGEVNQDPFLPLVLAAGATKRVGIGTAIAVAFARSPMTLAYTAHDLQRYSGGRLTLGLGSQVKAHVERRFSMPWSRPAARMREYVLALRAIWASWRDGTPLEFEGQFTRHTLMPRAFVPPPHEFGPPRVFVAGVGEGMTRAAAEVADGFLCHGFTTPRWLAERTLPALREGRARIGKDLTGFEVAATPFVVTGTDAEIEARLPQARAQIAFYASTPAYRGVFDLHGWGGLSEELTALSKAGRWADMGRLVTDEIVAEFATIAPPDQLPARLARRFGGTLTRMSLSLPAELGQEVVADLVARLRG